MTIKRQRRCLTVTAKSCGLLCVALLSGCLSDGSELIPPEPGSGGTTFNVVVGNGQQPGVPIYAWSVGPISFLDVVRTSNPNAPVWGFNVDGGADVVPSPVTHGATPSGTTPIGGSEPVLTNGVQYRVRITRNTTNQQFVAVFTLPIIATTAALASVNAEDGTPWTWDVSHSATVPPNAAVDDAAGPTRVVAIAAGGAHSLALHADGTVWSWGANESGQLGNNSTSDSATPVRVTGLARVIAVAAGERHSLALTEDGSVWAWGENGSSQVGDGTTVNRSVPVRVEFLSNIAAIAAGKLHSMALAADGTVWNWGGNYSGQLGDGTTANSARPVAAR